MGIRQVHLTSIYLLLGGIDHQSSISNHFLVLVNNKHWKCEAPDHLIRRDKRGSRYILEISFRRMICKLPSVNSKGEKDHFGPNMNIYGYFTSISGFTV